MSLSESSLWWERQWSQFLRGVSLFKDFKDEDFEKIIPKIQLVSLTRGSVLFRQGDDSPGLFIITSGRVRVVYRRINQESVEVILGPGDCLGESGVILEEKCVATVHALTSCEFLGISREDFSETLKEYPEIYLRLSQVLAHHVLQTNISRQNLGQRQAKFFAISSSLPFPERQFFSAYLGLQLQEQTRSRVLVVDMDEKFGKLASLFETQPPEIDREFVRKLNRREGAWFKTFIRRGAFGMDILSVPANRLAKESMQDIPIFLNLLRENYDIVLVHLGNVLGPHEQRVLIEVERVILVGSEEGRQEYLRLDEKMVSSVDPSQILRLWCGNSRPPGIFGDGWKWRIPWDSTVSDIVSSPEPLLKFSQLHPSSCQALERLARHLTGFSVGVAFGSGAALGYSIIGVLKVFKRERIPIDLVSGTSMGAFLAGLVAMGMEPEEMEKRAFKANREWIYGHILRDISIPHAGFFSGQSLFRIFGEYFQGKTFEDLGLPFSCVASDIESGEEVVLSKGSVTEATRASCSLPVIFTPFHREGRFLIDGGLVNPVPIRVVADMGADILIAINLTLPAADYTSGAKPGFLSSIFKALGGVKYPNVFHTLLHTLYTAEYEIAKSQLGIAHVIIQPEIKGVSWTDFGQAKSLIALGEIAAEKVVPRIKAMLPALSPFCQMPKRPDAI
jgi:NTE family protein